MKFVNIFAILFLISFSSASAQSQIVFFDESPTGNSYYDYSWGYVSDSSYLELAGPQNSKFPIELNHVFQGFHSLRLKWQSAARGDWGVAVASPGWTGYDLTGYDSILYRVNGPHAISQAGLPDLSLEDLSNHKSTRVWLGDYFSGVDDDTTTWQRVGVPLSAFQPGPQSCDFTQIKTIFHYQKAADNVMHEAWLDEIMAVKNTGGTTVPAAPVNLIAAGYDSRIDLRWRRNGENGLSGYNIYRAANPGGPYTRLNPSTHNMHLYSDFLSQNNQSFYYYVTAVNSNFDESPPSDTVSATSYSMTTEELLSSVQEATFRYFYDYGHPVSGMARERLGSGNTCASGGTGFGIMTMIVGAERGFEPRDSITTRILKILRFLQDDAQRFHGAWSHWINGATGQTIPFSPKDDGGDLVETSYLAQGLLTVRQYFDQNNAVENEIRSRASQMWEGIEWDWYLRYPNGYILYWHWSPNYGWAMNLPIRGYNEAMIVYLLAVASPTHPAPPLAYYIGWTRSGAYPYSNGNTFYGYKQWVGPNYGGPLFFTQYSYLGFDPRNKADGYTNYFENSRNISLINRAYCIDNPNGRAGYDSLNWGLTASDDPWGYSAHAPFSSDNGTITPTAALSAMPYVPDESIATLEHFYYDIGAPLWAEFGFKDAFNPGQNWYADSYIAIDQGPIVVMIENYRSQLCWNLFMSNPEIPQMLDALGFVSAIGNEENTVISGYRLFQNYPNPFNSTTMIDFSLPKASAVKLEVFNVRGQRVVSLLENKLMNAGAHQIRLDAASLASGVYYYKLKAGEFSQSKKMMTIK